MTDLDARTLTRRFLILRVTRWLPTGLLIPVFVLFLVDRGLTLTEIGVVTAAQGIAVMLLELPTGGLADAVGRRRVLLGASVFNLLALVLLLYSHTFVWFVVAFALDGVYRALESGPLEAWYVDGIHVHEPDADVEKGLSHAGVAFGIALGAGSLLGGAIVALDPFPGIDALAAPLVVAIALRLVDTVAVYSLMAETARPKGWDAFRRSVAEVPVIIKSAFGLVAGTASLALLIGVEITWGLSSASWEGFFPVRLEEVLGDAAGAAAVMGPAAAAAWLFSAVGSALTPRLTSRFGQYRAAAWMKLIQAGTVVAFGLIAGPVGLITAYLMSYLAFGAWAPVHKALIHSHASSANRTTVASLNSMAGMGAAAVGGILLGYVSDTISVSAGMWVAGVIAAIGAPLFLLAKRRLPTSPADG